MSQKIPTLAFPLVVLSGALLGCAAQSLAPGRTVAQMSSAIPPLAAGLARVWFLRQYEPSVSLRTPMMFVAGAPIAGSVPGTALFRDLPPGTYTFTVETCTVDTNQAATLNLAAGSQIALEVQALRGFATLDCPVDDTFYMRAIPPERAQLYYAQLTYLGAR